MEITEARAAMPKTKTSHNSRTSPVGWYVAILLERFEYFDEDKSKPDRKCEAWENTVLIQADSPEKAHAKAMDLGKSGSGVECVERPSGRKGKWKFIGLQDLVPIHEAIKDGAEILWTRHMDKTVRTVEGWVTPKNDLTCFRTENSEP